MPGRRRTLPTGAAVPVEAPRSRPGSIRRRHLASADWPNPVT